MQYIIAQSFTAQCSIHYGVMDEFKTLETLEEPGSANFQGSVSLSRGQHCEMLVSRVRRVHNDICSLMKTASCNMGPSVLVTRCQ